MEYSFDYLQTYYKEFLNRLIEEDSSLLPMLKLQTNKACQNWLDKLGLSFPSCNFFKGATRFVIQEDEMPYVLKIPLVQVSMSGVVLQDFDYCRAEVRNYKVAEREGLSKFFAWTEKLFDFEVDGISIPIYIMEYADVDESRISSGVKDMWGEEEDSEDSDDYTQSEYVEEFLEHEWGEEDYARFEEFCEENRVSDLHAANVGWVDGCLVCIDYSGFSSVIEERNNKDWWDILNEERELEAINGTYSTNWSIRLRQEHCGEKAV